ncbi:uncharacterized protein B4U80_01652 [Leptotrombidium deliense]|uniref:Ig-like domain-containing protein n=1 Tax=Leptotrombidium deliense TaxID=299467 RepID=A0A443SVR5_9ACAR|nr:uncharacterized protein B4U80_01652 [Leptotrombidium deliense]
MQIETQENHETNGAKITSLSVPKWVQNGTEEQIVLDCSYSLSKLEEKNFVLKWYFGKNRSEVIYHWIPDLDFRFVNGRIQRRFIWDYCVNTTNDKINKFRAIAIKRPTTEQNGLYTCEVSSDQGTDSKEAEMIIYESGATKLNQILQYFLLFDAIIPLKELIY